MTSPAIEEAKEAAALAANGTPRPPMPTVICYGINQRVNKPCVCGSKHKLKRCCLFKLRNAFTIRNGAF